MAHAGTTERELREFLGMSQVELAELAGVDQGYLSRFERGEVNPSPRWKRAVREVLEHQLGERGLAS